MQSTRETIDAIGRIPIERIRMELQAIQKEEPEAYARGIKTACRFLEEHDSYLYHFVVGTKTIDGNKGLRMNYLCVLDALGEFSIAQLENTGR